MSVAYDCGTSACAAGHATRIFPEIKVPLSFGVPKGRDLLGSFFGLTKDEVTYLFNMELTDEEGETPKAWSERCLCFLDNL